MVTLDYVTPVTGYEPKEMELTDADELNITTSSDIYFQNALDDTASFSNVPDVDDNELAEFLAVVVDRTGQPVEVRSINDQFSCDIRNLKSAQSQFPLVTQPKRMISQTGRSVQERIAEERESQIRTMLDEQRRTIIAEYSEKVLHHELFAAQAEQDRKILQEELLRQQQDFREVHQQDLIKQKELQKFQNSTFDEFAQKKFIEDQKIIMELSGRLQELQNEVNCMNDSRDFRDAESICSGNSHVTSPPGLFPRHPPFEGLLKPAFISQRQTEEPPNIRDTSGTSGNVFAHPQTSSSAPYPQHTTACWYAGKRESNRCHDLMCLVCHVCAWCYVRPSSGILLLPMVWQTRVSLFLGFLCFSWTRTRAVPPVPKRLSCGELAWVRTPVGWVGRPQHLS